MLKKDFKITDVKINKNNLILHKIHTTNSQHYGFVHNILGVEYCKDEEVYQNLKEGDEVCGHFISEGFEYLLIGSVFEENKVFYINADKVFLRTNKPFKTQNLAGLSDKQRTEYSKKKNYETQ